MNVERSPWRHIRKWLGEMLAGKSEDHHTGTTPAE
jgi:hypothetical protein